MGNTGVTDEQKTSLLKTCKTDKVWLLLVDCLISSPYSYPIVEWTRRHPWEIRIHKTEFTAEWNKRNGGKKSYAQLAHLIRVFGGCKFGEYPLMVRNEKLGIYQLFKGFEGPGLPTKTKMDVASSQPTMSTPVNLQRREKCCVHREDYAKLVADHSYAICSDQSAPAFQERQPVQMTRQDIYNNPQTSGQFHPHHPSLQASVYQPQQMSFNHFPSQQPNLNCNFGNFQQPLPSHHFMNNSRPLLKSSFYPDNFNRLNNQQVFTERRMVAEQPVQPQYSVFQPMTHVPNLPEDSPSNKSSEDVVVTSGDIKEFFDFSKSTECGFSLPPVSPVLDAAPCQNLPPKFDTPEDLLSIIRSFGNLANFTLNSSPLKEFNEDLFSLDSSMD